LSRTRNLSCPTDLRSVDLSLGFNSAGIRRDGGQRLARECCSNVRWADVSRFLEDRRPECDGKSTQQSRLATSIVGVDDRNVFVEDEVQLVEAAKVLELDPFEAK
jgi:hypothetical protein